MTAGARSGLGTYRKKRDFDRTAEPAGRVQRGKGNRFVFHEHHASSLHFDLRLEMGGVLKSWAVPKGPSLDPKDRRLAIETEDHPVQYLGFQGSIADGQYGAGEMRIWDRGTWATAKGEEAQASWQAGRLHIVLQGERLHGAFMLVRTARDPRQWLFFKLKDEEAVADWTPALILPYGSRAEKPGDLEDAPAAADAIPPPEPLPAMKRAKTLAAARRAGTADPRASAHPSRKPARRKARAWPKETVTSKLPSFAPPMLAILADAAFDDADWVFETKWDGWRAQLIFDGKKTRFLSRNRKSLDAHFPELADLGRVLGSGPCVLDGEIVALDEKGDSRFQLLQGRLKGKGRGAGDGGGVVVFYAFDLLHLEGRDLTGCALVDRKALLETLLPEAGSKAAIRYSPHFPARGKKVFAEAVRLGFEGMMAKRARSPYRPGRSADWLKVKVKQRQEVVIAGMTRPRKSRTHFGSLVAGLYEGPGKGAVLRFAGHVGGGFDARLLAEVHGLLAPLATRKSPFPVPPKTNEAVTWLEPRKVGEVEFAEWTSDGLMRQPVFLGLRPDKDPKECRREVAGNARALKAEAEAEAGQAAQRAPDPAVATDHGPAAPPLTHPEKIYWPGEGITKGELVRYYGAVAPTLLPHLAGRPLILKRFPDGIERPPFYQHAMKDPPPYLRTVEEREERGSLVRYAVCDNKESLLYLANLGCIPMHPFLSRAPRLDRPDFTVFDLDPGDVPFAEAARQAVFLGGLLRDLGLESFPKTSGSRGLHVYVPLAPIYDFSQSLDFARLVAEWAVRERPEILTVERSLKARPAGRIYLDCMQNARGKSVACAYSVREKPGAPVSAPLTWAELKKGIRMEDFHIGSMPERLKKKGDLFAATLKGGQRLEKPVKALAAKLAADEVPRPRRKR